MECSPALACGFKNLNNLTKLGAEDYDLDVYRSVEGGGTGREYPSNLYEDQNADWCKWYDCQSEETWIELSFIEPTRIQFLQLKSANDCPERDPYEITITYQYNNGKENILAHYDNLIWNDRYEIKDFNLDTECSVNKLRISINRNRSYAEENHWGSGTQLAQVIVYK